MGGSRCFGIRNDSQYGSVSETEMQTIKRGGPEWPVAPPRRRPGQDVRGSTTGRPLMAAMDLLGRRWALRILWELRDGPTGARALRAKCDDMSSSVLYDRLRDLGASGLVGRTNKDEYVLSELGRRAGSRPQTAGGLGRFVGSVAAPHIKRGGGGDLDPRLTEDLLGMYSRLSGGAVA